MVASTASPRLCGGIFVAIPTAMPDEPFTRRLGKAAGRTVGSSRVASKLGEKSTVFFSMSLIISAVMAAMRASV